ncbi:hypothetical protein CPT_Muldoon_023 [Serratia phage Muldoon]|uniref:Uncharacterized protein n=1 Tax=Serratia phage Muldoon TaxID=2601678 RepID=A0A5P8PIW0_9CAUD|nr:hypothetical protein HYP94_gp023 [Serratia phage Muldoon]QFR55980.1 hypothetical protein CPT_Muldoon_023 [Serratia phage Muldoon]
MVMHMKIKVERKTIEPKNRMLTAKWTVDVNQDVAIETQIEAQVINPSELIEYDQTKYISCGIIPDQPTIIGTVYSKEAAERAIEDFRLRGGIVADEAILPKKQPKPEHVNVGTIGRVNLGKSCLSLAVAQLLGPQYAEISK